MELKAGMWIRMNSLANRRYILTKEGSYGIIAIAIQGKSMVKFATLTGISVDISDYLYEIENSYFEVLSGPPAQEVMVNYLLRWVLTGNTELAKIGHYLGHYQGGRK